MNRVVRDVIIDPATQFPRGHHGMAALIREFDWAATPLGPIIEWGGTLRATVSFMLGSSIPLVLMWGEAGTILYNDAFAAFSGDRHPDQLGQPAAKAWPDGATFAEQVLRHCLRGGTQSFRELPYTLSRDGARQDVWLDLHYSPVRNRRNQPVGVLSLVTDTTERVLLQHRQDADGRRLQQSEEHLKALTSAIPQLVWTANAAGDYDFFNDRWREFTGLDAGATDVKTWLSVVHPDDQSDAALNWRHAIESGQGYQSEYRLRRADGVWRWFLRRALPVRDAATGQVERWVGSCTDIEHTVRARDMLRQSALELEARVRERTRQLTEEQQERQKAEAQLLQAQKMEAMGNLTGGVAHDFNNLLQVIHGSLELLAEDVAGQREPTNRVHGALEAVERGARLASQLLAFGRRQPLQPRVVNIGRFVSRLEDLLRRSLGEQVELETVVAAELWNTMVDPGQVQNALLNLAINARDAMNGQGQLTIEASNAVLDETYARMNPEAVPGSYVVLSVSDTGTGMTPEVQAKVFEPFFTTKPEGQGTGLGLSMVYGFVRQSGGHVVIYSEPGQGTCIKLYLPRSEAEEQQDSLPSAPAVGGGTETVLVVEDDDAVRGVVVETLTGLGYRVLRARDAQAALSIIESGMPIDLLFTDVVMPGPIRSTELAERARARLPGIAVLFTSGYAENAIVHGGRLDAGVELLSKPYSRQALARKFRHVLANQAQRSRIQAGPSQAAVPPLTVLLVEDDAAIRADTSEILRRAGHSVEIAPEASVALSLLKSRRFDLLMTDIGLPGLTGDRLAAEARVATPGIAVVFASGENHLPAAMRDSAVLLRKPYNTRRLLGSLGEAMALRTR